MPMMIGVPRERYPGERRVALTPETIGHLHKLGFNVTVEAEAGELAAFSDDAYRAAGAQIAADAAALYAGADIVVKVRAPQQDTQSGIDEIALLREGSTLISFIWPAQNPELMQQLAARKVDRARDGSRAAHLARAEDGRADVRWPTSPATAR